MKHFRNLQRLIALAVMLAAPLAAVAGTNFRVVNLPPEQGADYGRAADEAYSRLSRWWFGKRLPDLWRPGQLAPVPITVHLQPQGSGGGRTSFRIEGGHVFGWKMTVAGSPQKILDDAIPHEVGHVVFYARFRRPLGRCLDEGTAGIGESSREHAAARQRVADALRHKAVLPFSRILDEQRYPQPSATLLFYAQSHSLVEFLLQRKGRERFVAFLDDPRSPSVKLREFYGINSEQLQDAWEAWFRERSTRGLECENFGCPVHVRAKPQALRGTNGEDRLPVVYAFTAGWCSACKPFQRDVAAGRFPAYRFVFVDPDADGKRWNEITAKMAAETGHRGGVPLPSWWVPGSKRLAVMRNGYSASGLLQILRGLIRGLLRLLDNPHLSPDGTPQGTRPRGDGTPVPSGPAGDAATATTPSLTRKDLKAELLTFGRQFVRKEVKAAIVAKITGGEPPDPLRDLKQEIVFWLASIGLPLWLVERITKHRRLATQVHKAWQRLRSSSPSSPPSAASAEPPASSSAPSPASGSDSTSSG